MNTIIINNITYYPDDELLNMTLLDYLREILHLTGTKNGCNIGVCGACTVLVNNIPKRSCKTLLKDVIAQNITTIEGMSDGNGGLHPLQQAFIDAGAIQCGFCTPGMVLSAHALLLKNNNPDKQQVKMALNSNLCRCTGYQQIFDAVLSAAKYYK
jgi:carbon-monoxide dehydrogenase small subunit